MDQDPTQTEIPSLCVPFLKGQFPEKANSPKAQPTGICWIFSLLWGDVAGGLLTPCSHCHHKETALRNTLLSFPLPLPAAASNSGTLGNAGEGGRKLQRTIPRLHGAGSEQHIKEKGSLQAALAIPNKAALIHQDVLVLHWLTFSEEGRSLKSQTKTTTQGELCCRSMRWGQRDPGLKGEDLSKKAKPSPVSQDRRRKYHQHSPISEGFPGWAVLSAVSAPASVTLPLEIVQDAVYFLLGRGGHVETNGIVKRTLRIPSLPPGKAAHTGKVNHK